MASHSSSGSAATSTSAPSDTASAMDGNGSGDPGMPGLSSSSSLPFSFLVTFVAIFLFFLGCGLGSRRVTRTLRRNLGLEVTGLRPGDNDGRVARIPRKRPLLWDAFPHAAPLSSSSPLGFRTRDGHSHSVRVFSHPWDVLAPLSATYVRTSPPAAAAPPPLAPGPETATTSQRHLAAGGFVPSRGLMRAIPRLPPPPTPRAPPNASSSPTATASAAPRRAAVPEIRWRGHRIPDWIARPLMPDSLDRPLAGLGFDPDSRAECSVPDEAAEGEREVQALQVVFLISLPSPERARAARVRAKALEANGGRRESGGSERFGVEVDVEASVGTTIGEYLLGTARVPWEAGEIGGSR